MKRYDRAYFDRWYRHPVHRVRTRAELARRAALVVGIAEYLLGRPLRTVLDVGAGEGEWGPALRRLRPGVRYVGVEPSAYAVRRHGARRGLVRGSLGGLEAVPAARPADLVICADVLHYLAPAEVTAGLAALRERTRAVAYLPVFTAADPIEGDHDGFLRRPPAWYRARFRAAGFTSVGFHCHVPGDGTDRLVALERPA